MGPSCSLCSPSPISFAFCAIRVVSKESRSCILPRTSFCLYSLSVNLTVIEVIKHNWLLYSFFSWFENHQSRRDPNCLRYTHISHFLLVCDCAGKCACCVSRLHRLVASVVRCRELHYTLAQCSCYLMPDAVLLVSWSCARPACPRDSHSNAQLTAAPIRNSKRLSSQTETSVWTEWSPAQSQSHFPSSGSKR